MRQPPDAGFETRVEPARGGSGAWKVAVLLGLAFAWVVGWYYPTAAEIAHIWWRSDTFAHGLAVLPIFAWLVWRKRETLDAFAPAPAPAALAAVVAAGGAWLVGELVSVSALSHVALAVILVAGFIAVIGWPLARVLAFPLLFLFFGVPVGEFLLPVLMRYTADFTVLALRATGIPVYQENLYFIVPNGRWSVVEACSGLRYLVASLMVGALYAYLNYVSLRRRLLFMLVALAVPIVANWVRAYITVMIGYHFGSEFVEGFIHIVYGWVFFGIVIGIMFVIGARWNEAPVPPAAVRAHSVPASRGRWLALAPVALAMALFPLLLARLERPAAAFEVALAAPAAKPGWTLAEGGAHAYRPSFQGHRGEVFQAYRRDDGTEVGLYIAYYAAQRKGEELVMHGNSLSGQEEGGWRRTRNGEARLSIGPVRHAALSRGYEQLELWGWYWINGRVVSNDYLAKALLALDRLTGRTDDSAVVVVTVPARTAEASGLAAAETFVRDFAQAIDTLLIRTEAGR